MPAYPNFVGPTYRSQSRVADAEVCRNWYVERMESPGAKVPAALYPTPGAETRIRTADAPGRTFYALNGRCFGVIGPTLYEVLSDLTVVNRGTMLTDDRPATLWGNGDTADELFITSAGAGYVYDLVGNTLTPIPALATGADIGAYLDGYFLSLDIATSTFRISELADGTTWPALQAQQRNAFPDRWQSMLVDNRDLWLFGSLTSDVWQNAGTSPFPFQPVQGANVMWGTEAPFSPAVLGSPIWLGASREGAGVVIQAEGYRARRVSTHAVEFAIQRYTTRQDARGWVYQQDGHLFYVLTFPTAEATWVYDAATREWHERDFWDVRTGTSLAWRPMWHAYAFDRHLVLDRITGDIHELNLTYGYDVDTAAIRRVRRAPHLQGDGRPTLIMRDFQLDMETGLGTPIGQGEDPQVMLRLSADGARTWGVERRTSAGRQGRFLERVQWNRLGSGRDLVIEIAVSDPIPWRILGASHITQATRW